MRILPHYCKNCQLSGELFDSRRYNSLIVYISSTGLKQSSTQTPEHIVATKSIDILLVLPPLYQGGREPDYNPKEPMGLMYLSPGLREDGWNTEIFDADIEAKTIKETIRYISLKNPAIVGFSVFQRALPSLELIVKEMRGAGYAGHITCGGITPTLSFKAMLDRLGNSIDSVVLGEGEHTLRELASKVLSGNGWRSTDNIAYRYNGQTVSTKRTLPPEPRDLPHPSRDYLQFCLEKTNYATILGSRGCYGICTFCSNFTFESSHHGKRWRPRDPLDIVDEIENLFTSYRVNVFKFNDPNMFGPGKRGREHVMQVCQEISRRKLQLHMMGFCRGNDITADPYIAKQLRAAGFERLLVGIESSDDFILRKFRKGESISEMKKAIDVLNSADISTVAGFMIFNPYTTLESLKRDVCFLKERGFTPILSKALRVFDETPIQRLLEIEGRLVYSNPFEGYHNYTMPQDIAAIYASMKTVFIHCLDKIRAAHQTRIWEIKKSDSFRDRQDFNELSSLFFRVESALLEQLIIWTQTQDFTIDTINDFLKPIYAHFRKVGLALRIDICQIITPRDFVARQIFTIMKEKPWNTFLEKYRWGQD